MRKRSLALALVLVLAACGGDDNGHTHPDASTTTDSAPPADAAPDAYVLPAGCDFAELADATNDDFTQMGMPEATSLTFSTSLTLCGTINSGHFDDQSGAVDVDSFKITLTADADVIVDLTGTGAEALDFVAVEAFTGTDFGTGAGAGSFLGDHAVFSRHFAAGDYELSMLAGAMAATTTDVAYKIHINMDAPTTRCPTKTGTADYAEASDGAGNTDNDVVTVDYDNSDALTAAATDAPEATALTVAGGTAYLITGTSANNAKVGSYFDVDTYEITTGATTNQLAIRLNWPGTTADFDYYLFEKDSATSVTSGSKIGKMEDEFVTFSVLPNTSYWLWVGAYAGTAQDTTGGSTGLPIDYSATVCAETFTP